MPNIITRLQKKISKQYFDIALISLENAQLEAKIMTYGELDKKARSVAAYLQATTTVGERVILFYPTGIDFVVSFLGCLYAGIIAIPVFCPNKNQFKKVAEFAKSVIDNAQICGILTNEIFINELNNDFAEIIFSKKIFLTANAANYSSVEYQSPKINQNMIAYLQYTSGSTTAPRAAIISHQNLLHNIKNSSAAWHYVKKSIFLTWSPHSHVFGLVCGIILPLYNFSKVVMLPPEIVVKKPRSWLEAITKYKVTHSGCPNFGYDLCVKYILDSDLAGLDLSSWKVAISGGENVKSDTLLQFSHKFKTVGFTPENFISAYGMSELSGTISTSRYMKKPIIYEVNTSELTLNNIEFEKDNSGIKLVSNGKLIPGLQILIVDPVKKVSLPSKKVGEIWLSGKSLIKGYWQGVDLVEDIYVSLPGSKKKYFCTGDLGFKFKNQLCVVGRSKDVIVRYGKKYYPHDLEATIGNVLTEFDVKTCIALPIQKQNEDDIVLLIEINGFQGVNKTNIIEKCNRALFENHGITVQDIYLIKENSIPKTASGKIQRKLCQRLFIENKIESHPLDKETVVQNNIEKPVQEIGGSFVNKLTQEFKNIIAVCLSLDVNQVNLTDSLSHYNLDSITIVALSAKMSDALKCEITPDVLYSHATFLDLFNDIVKENYQYLLGRHSDIIKNDSGNFMLDTKEENSPEYNENLATGDIAIIGMNGKFPGAENLELFWNNLIQKNDQIKKIPIERWNSDTSTIKWGGFIDDISHFDAQFFGMSPREAELTDPQQRIFLQTVWQTIEDAGYAISSLAQKKVGVFVGVFTRDYAELLFTHEIAEGYTTTGTTHSILANRISYLFNFQGPSEAIDTACSSSLVAIHHAILAIQNGDCEMAIAGGVNALLTPTSYTAASHAGMLSVDGRCKTFDKEANGYVRAEGVGAILLKPLKKAQLDGDHIYGIIKGTAVNHGGHVSSLTVPNPSAQADVIIAATQRSRMDINAINYIEAHGTGTSLGDPIEINGLKRAFTTLADDQKTKLGTHFCAIGSLKTHIGHLEAAAGIASVIKVLLSMKYKYLPGNLHLQTMNPYINLSDSPFYLLNDSASWTLPLNTNQKYLTAGISSFGFGGTNAHIIVQECPSVTQSSHFTHFPVLLTFSAKSEYSLRERLKQFLKFLLEQVELPSLSAISYTLNVGRDHFDKRCALIIEDIEELKQSLESLIKNNVPSNALINLSKKDTGSPLFQELCQSLTLELRNANLTVDEIRKKLLLLANFYVEGYNLDWSQLQFGEKKRVSLPTYPFEKNHYWIPTTQKLTASVEDISQSLMELSSVKKILIDTISMQLKINESNIAEAVTLSELGVDSIAIKDLTLNLEKRFNIEIGPSVFYTYNNISSLSEYIFSTIKPKKYSSHLSSNQLYSRKNSEEPIAIIGMQGYLPQSDNLEIFWEHLLAGHDLITEVPSNRWNWSRYFGDAKKNATKTNSKWGGFINDFDQFDASFFNISAREANLMDPQHRLFLEIVWKTIEDAGYNPFNLSSQEVGLFVGIEFNEYQTLIAAQNSLYHGHVATGNSHALLANRISYFLNLQGPSEVINTACSSALVAVHRSIVALRNYECHLCVAGGVSLMLTPETFIITSQLGALSPEGRCKTFDKSANGYVKGEGVAAVLLKRLSDAQADGDSIYGIIRGSAVNHGGKAQSLTAPNVTSQCNLLVKAYTQAQVDPKTITYIETHGTGTELGDPVEIEGLKHAFEKLLGTKMAVGMQPFCALGSVKTNIGHLEPASGMAGLIKVLLSMRYGKIPGNLHFNELSPFINISNTPFYILNKTQDWPHLLDQSGFTIPRRAGVSSFGFGGTGAHIVIEEAPVSLYSEKYSQAPYFLITLSAREEESLKQKVIDLQTYLVSKKNQIDLELLGFTLGAGRAHFNYRHAFVVKNIQELISSLESVRSGNHADNSLSGYVKLSSDASSSLRYPTLDLSDQDYLESLLFIATSYVQGTSPEWEKLTTRQQRLNSLPSYPFIKKRYWFDAEISNVVTQEIKSIQTNEAVQELDLEKKMLSYLQGVFATKLRISPDKILSQNTYEVYGIDSLLTLEITSGLEENFGPLPKTLLYEKNTLNDLAKYFLKKYSVQVQRIFSSSPIPSEKHTPDRIMAPITETKLTFTPKNSGKEIAIVGINISFPMAKNMEEFWDILVAGRDCITEIPRDRWDYRDFPISRGDQKKYFKYGGFIPDVDKFDPLFFNISPREAILMDPQERLFLQSAWSVVEDAGYTRERLKHTVNNNVGVFAGVTYNFYPLLIQEEWQKGNQLPLDIQLFSVANRTSYCLNLNGPSYVVDTACSSSLAAIHLACESILSGECSAAIAGGVNLSIHPAKYHFLGGYGFLSEKGRCESFGKDGEGYVPSEGVGTVFLKPLEMARRDNDRIYAIIKGSSMNHGAKTSGYTVPSPSAQAQLVKTALEKSGINPRTISYIEAHGTGTSLGDPIEVSGLQEAFEIYTEEKQFCAIGSVKSNLGHLESAAGISQLAKVLLQFKYKKIAPSIHSEILNPYIDFKNSPFYVQQKLTEWIQNDYPRRAGISSFGAGGTNVHLIVEEFVKPALQNNEVRCPIIFLLSAQNKERLYDNAKQFLNFIITNIKKTEPCSIDKDLQNLCYTLQVGRENMASRLAILAINCEELIHCLSEFIKEPERNHSNIWINVADDHPPVPSQELELLASEKNFKQLCQHWVNGEAIAWEKILYGSVLPEIISAPTYPFAKRRCWVTPLAPISDVGHHCFSETENKWLIFNDKALGFHLQREFSAGIHCFMDADFNHYDKNTFYLDPANSSHVQLLLNSSSIYDSQLKQLSIKGIIYCWSLLENEMSSSNTFLANLFAALKGKELIIPIIILMVDENETKNKDLKNHMNFILEEQKKYWDSKHCPFFVINLNTLRSLSKEALFVKDEIEKLITLDSTDTKSEKQIVNNDEITSALDASLPIQEIATISTTSHLASSISREITMDHVMKSLASLLEMDVSEIDPEVAFLNYGLDSILGITFIAELNTYYNDLLSPMDLYRYPTVNQLAMYIANSNVQEVENIVEEDESFMEEELFLNSINHLNKNEISSLLENELQELDKLLDEV